VASPSVRDSFIRYTSPVYPGASSILVPQSATLPETSSNRLNPIRVTPHSVTGLTAPQPPLLGGIRGAARSRSHMNGIHEVTGSIPVSSTKSSNNLGNRP
jgi:hypothetical protein